VNRLRSPLTLLILLSLFILAPLLASGYFLHAHDARHSLIWLVEYDQGIRDGFLWPRWAPDHSQGYGYPLFTFYAPLAFAIAEVFHLLGASIVGAVKITWALATIFAGVSMYKLARSLWGVGPAFIAGLLYMTAPYHLVNIYVRGSLAEFVALALYPWVVYSFLQVLERQNARSVALAALSLGLLIMTHSVTLMLLPPLLALLILYWLALDWRREGRLPWRATMYALAAGLLGGMLAAIFLLPVIGETKYIVVDQWLPAESYNYPQQFLYLFQWFDFTWGYGFALPGPDDGMNLSVGLWLMVLGLAALPLALSARRGAQPPVNVLSVDEMDGRPKTEGREANSPSSVPGPRSDAPTQPSFALWIGFFLIALIALFATLAPSKIFWDVIPMIKLVQFPFRFLAPATLFLALAAAGSVAALLPARKDQLNPVLLVLAAAILLGSWAYAKPQHTSVTEADQSPVADIQFELDYPDMRGSTAFAGDKPVTSPKVEAYLAGDPIPLAGIIEGAGAVETLRHGAGSEEVRVQAERPVTLQFYTYWYPGWRAWIDGEEVETRPEGADALITLDAPAGEHDVRIRFTNTPLRTFSAIITVVTLLILVILFFWDTIRQRF